VTVALRPGVWLLLRTLTLLSTPHPDWPIEKRRAQDSADTAVLMKLLRPAPGRVVQADYQVPVGGREILVRCYVPEGTGPFPGHLYLHGGAFWAGSVADYDPLCRWYAAAGGCVVAAVDYDLAPQSKYPVQVEQAYAALRWLAANAADLGVRADRLSVGGTAAGPRTRHRGRGPQEPWPPRVRYRSLPRSPRPLHGQRSPSLPPALLLTHLVHKLPGAGRRCQRRCGRWHAHPIPGGARGPLPPPRITCSNTAWPG
jgi:alpha/beta hydrolase fold